MSGTDSPVRLVPRADCLGRQWLVSPEQRIIFYASTLDPVATAAAILEADAALAEYEAHPRLRLVHSA